jgi:DNA-binding transcriptional MocR family regulator
MKAYSGYDVDIIYTGSFSKILGPGFRLGYMLSSVQIFEKAEMIKQALDACTSNFMQILACEFMERGYLHSYLKFLRKEYSGRKEIMKTSLKKHLPDFVHWNEPKGGFYIWLSLPSDLSASAVFRDCLEQGVVFVTGKTFDPLNLNDSNIRLSFSNMAKEDIEKGVILLAEVILRHYENSKRSKTSIQIR